MAKQYAWYYNGSAIGGATAKTHTLTSGQTDSNLIECRVQVDYGADQVAALAKYVVTAPTVTDDFNRADENLEASANWTGGGSIFAIVSNQVRVASIFGGITEYTGASPGSANQFASIVFKTATSVSAENILGLVIRSADSGTGLTGYWIKHNHAAGTIALVRLDPGFSEVSLDSGAYSASLDDELRIEADSSSIVVKINDVTILTGTDSTYTAEGTVRLFAYQDGASDIYEFDDFTQGAL